MEEKTKELKKIDEIEDTLEEQEHTKKINIVSEEEILKDEISEEKEENKQLEEPIIEHNIDDKPIKENKKTSKKKLLIIIGIIFIIIIILLVIIILLNKNPKQEIKKEKVDYSDYGNTIYKSLEKGKLDSIINEELKKNKIKTNTVTLLNIDIDSDNRQDLVVFASENNNKILLNLNVKDEVSYEKSYRLDSRNSIGYLFSRKDEKFYWYVNYNNKIFPIDGHSNYIKIDSEENMFQYDLITQKYKNEIIMDYGLKYNFDKKLDIEELEELKISNKDMLNNINITIAAAK